MLDKKLNEELVRSGITQLGQLDNKINQKLAKFINETSQAF